VKALAYNRKDPDCDENESSFPLPIESDELHGKGLGR